MDSREAREHLEMVDEILRQGERNRSWSCKELGVSLCAIGAGAALINLAQQLGSGSPGTPDARLVIAGGVFLFAGVVYMIVSLALSRRNAERLSFADIRTGRVMSAVWVSVFVAAFCQPHLLPGWSASAIWSVGGAISLLVNGFFGDRRALGGGLALLASMLVANYVPSITGYALAAGFAVGYVLVGISYLTGVGAPNDRG